MSLKKRQKEVEIITENFRNLWFKRITNLAYSSIVWDGFPANFDYTYLEYCLVNNGSAIAIRDKMLVGNYRCGLNCSTGLLDEDGVPMSRAISFRNGRTANYSISDSVIVFNNVTRSEDIYDFTTMANEMADIDMAIRVNILVQRTMPIIPTTTTKALSVENIMSSIANNIPYILIEEDSLELNKLKEALQFDNRRNCVTDLLAEVQDIKWRRILSILGLNSSPVVKKERVNIAETQSNLDELMAMRNNRISTRKLAAEEMRLKWGIKVTPHFVSDTGGGVLFGNLYSGGQDVSARAVDTGTSGTAPAQAQTNNQ